MLQTPNRKKHRTHKTLSFPTVSFSCRTNDVSIQGLMGEQPREPAELLMIIVMKVTLPVSSVALLPNRSCLSLTS